VFVRYSSSSFLESLSKVAIITITICRGSRSIAVVNSTYVMYVNARRHPITGRPDETTIQHRDLKASTLWMTEPSKIIQMYIMQNESIPEVKYLPENQRM